ncbi:protein LURP-one-related 10-like [Wolffia australiana]
MSPPIYHSSAAPISVVNPEFCSPNWVEIFLKNKVFSLTGHDFTVKDAKKKVLFQVKKACFSLRDRVVLQDASRRPLITLRRKLFTARSTWKVFRGEGTDDADLLFIAKRSRVMQLKTTLHVFLATNTKALVPDFKVKGSYSERSCTVYLGDSSVVVAERKKQEKVKNKAPGKESLKVTICPNVDQALIVALIIIHDEINKEGESGEAAASIATNLSS